MRKYDFIKLDINNIEDCIRGWIAAFPNWKYEDALKTAKETVDIMCYFGAYEDGVYKGLIVGADTSFNFRGKVIKGIELDHLHVEPLYRKAGVSKFLIDEFQKYAVDNGYFIINVGPFSTEFYRNMGYGFGSKAMSFKSKPINYNYFKGTAKYLEYYDGENRKEELEQFIKTQRNGYHGSYNYKATTLKDKFEKLCNKNRIVVMSIIDNKICGVIDYEAARSISIDDFLFNHPLAIQSLSSYLHSLNGNIEYIQVCYAQPAILAVCNRPYEICLNEESMIKVIDMKKFIETLKNVDFKANDISIEFCLFDSLTGKSETINICCENNYLQIAENNAGNQDVKINMNLSDFTTMMFSQQTFETYISTGLAQISDMKYVSDINALFSYEDTPYNI